MTRALIAALAFLALGASAAAQDTARPVLKSSITVNSDVVRVGDLIDNAGAIAKVAIFRAPDLGTTGTVSADAVVEAIRTHALIGLDTGGIKEVVVTRSARAIPAEEVSDVIARELSMQYSLGPTADIQVTFERDMRVLYVDPAATGKVRVGRITYEPRSGRFDAILEIPTGATSHGNFRVTGRAYATVEVVTIAHLVERGAILKDSDIMVERRPRSTVGRDVITDREQVVGLAARGPMTSGRLLRAVDLMKPELVQRNQSVTIVYELPGILLTVRGKAMEGGAEGDTVAVLNEQSKRTVHGRVVGPGHVSISTSPAQFAAVPRPASE